MSVRIVDVCEITKPISSPIRNAYIDFTKMTTSLVAVVTDAVRDGKRVVGYGFNSNGRYGQGGLIRERFAPRLKEADPKSLLNADGGNLDPDKVWTTLCIPHGGHQMSLNIAAGLGLGGNESYPDLFQPYGGFPDGVRVENGHITMPDLPGIGFEGKSDLYKEMKALAA